MHLLFGGLNLADGKGLVSFNGSFLSGWPPLYPILIGLVHLLTGLNPFVSATMLQILAYATISVCLSILFLRIFPENLLLMLAANALSDIGAVMLMSFDIVGSDYLHLALVMLFILLAGYYMETRSPRMLVGMSVVGMLSMLQRYLGVAVIATGAALMFFAGGSLRRRIGRSFLMGVSALPAGLWLLITSGFSQGRAPVGLWGNFEWFSKSILEWFFPPALVEENLGISITCLWIFVLSMFILLLVVGHRGSAMDPFSTALFVYGVFYLLFLFGSASITYFNKLAGRFLLPLYVPFMTLFFLSIESLWRLAGTTVLSRWRLFISTGLSGALILTAGGLSRVTLPLVLESHNKGVPGENAFNNAAWHENDALQYWLAHQPPGDYSLFSNYPDGIAFYTWHACKSSPEQFSGPYGTEEFPIAGYKSELFSSGRNAYLIWIKPNAYDFYYEPQDLVSIARIQTLFQSRDGGVYRLVPKPDDG